MSFQQQMTASPLAGLQPMEPTADRVEAHVRPQAEQVDDHPADKFSWINILKQSLFWLVHLGCFAVIWTGVSWIAAGVCVALYFIRMFGITGVYHRYFSHRSYKTSRPFQFILACIGASAAQKGPIWWASHHRHHHQHSDTEEDQHSPLMHGIYQAHLGWILSDEYVPTRETLVRDLTKMPEIRFIDNYHGFVPFILAVGMFGFGVLCEKLWPSLGTNGWQMLVWGFFISTTLLYHGTFLINSAAHVMGKRRFNTTDDSRNSFILAILTMGEGWHNNHHRYPGAERQGYYWWEIDMSHYVLRALSWVGLVWDLRTAPHGIYAEAKKVGPAGKFAGPAVAPVPGAEVETAPPVRMAASEG